MAMIARTARGIDTSPRLWKGLVRVAATMAAAALVAAVSSGCGGSGPTTSTAGSASSATSQPAISTTTGAATGTTVAVSTDTSGGAIPQTTVVTGTTLPGGTGGVRALTFVGRATPALWQALRQIVIDSGGEGQKVLDQTARQSVGSAVQVGLDELDAVSGIGFAAGADTSQPIAVAVGDDGREVLVFAFTVLAKPQMATIVGFERYTRLVILVEGPLPISSSTGNITTIPPP